MDAGGDGSKLLSDRRRRREARDRGDPPQGHRGGGGPGCGAGIPRIRGRDPAATEEAQDADRGDLGAERADGGGGGKWGFRGEWRVEAGRRGEDAILVGKKGVTLQKGGRTLYKAEHGAGVVLSTTRGDPSHAVIRFGERELEVGFGSPRECARCVLAARAYAAWDTVCLICSLPAVEKEVTPDVSVVSALIQAGSAVQPFTWVIPPFHPRDV